MTLADLRREYTMAGLREEDCLADPFQQFDVWFRVALESEIPDVNAAALATCTRDGRPSNRMVLIKGADPRGFVFFTNYLSRKARELEENPRAALCIFWAPLERQIRIEGMVEKVTPEESDEYHRTRPRGSQLGAWCSTQSQVIPSRAYLEARLAEVEKQFENQEVPCPPNWGGYRLIPETIEFWQGRVNRLHDRICYRRVGDAWIRERLSP
jgi:pyridoxamine 5'-phosphate oxidase